MILIVLRGFFIEHQGLLRASALTYNTLLTLVPVVAFMLAFLKGLGIQNILELWLIDKLSVGSEDMVRQIITYASRIEAQPLGLIGLGTLLCTTVLQVSNVEQSFNAIWGVQTARPLLRKIADYVSILVMGPVVLVLATGINTYVHNQPSIVWLKEFPAVRDTMAWFSTVLPYGALWLVFAFFYAILPNTRVQALPALIGGIVGGTLWQGAQWIYIQLQIGMANAQIIYGALAQLPVLMLWIYGSWVVTLLGAEVTFACQNATLYCRERLGAILNIRTKEWLAQALYFSVAYAFMNGQGAWSAVAFARQHRIPLHLLHDILAALQQKQLLIEVAADAEHYVPGCDPATVTPWDITQAIRHYGDHTVEDVLALDDTLATTLMTQCETAQQQIAGTQSIAQWLLRTDRVDKRAGRGDSL